MSDSRSKRCGPHLELSANDAARVTRCTCGTLHVHLHGQGITLRMPADAFRHVANAISAAQRLVDMTDRAATVPSDTVN
jgi:hypothetical protein